MNEKITALILYDNNGKIWGVYTGETTIPSGMQGFIAEVENKPIERITLNMATIPPTPTIVYGRTISDTDGEVNNLQDALIELEERVSALEG